MARRQSTPTQPTALMPNVAGVAPFTALQTVMNRLLEDAWRGYAMPTTAPGSALGIPEIDVSENDTAVIVTADRPGLSAEEIDVEYTDSVLRIAGEKSAEQERGAGTRQYVTERYVGRFERRIPLDRRSTATRSTPLCATAC